MKRNIILTLALLGLLVIAYTPAFAQAPTTAIGRGDCRIRTR